MAKKRNRSRRAKSAAPGSPSAGGRNAGSSAPGSSKRRRKKGGTNPMSLVFIGLLVLMVAAIVLGSVLGGDGPACPPGQVWSDAHGHCH